MQNKQTKRKANNPKIVVVMPAYNAARTVHETFNEIPKAYRENVILVDDHSSDDTVEVAKKLGIKVFSHPNNLGYGGNQKTCYWEALKLNPDVVVMLHPDYQYDASMMPYLVQPVLDGKFDYMFGSRIATKKTALEGGMPPIKYYVNRIVCFIQNILLGVNFTEHFSGYRAYSKKFLKTVPFQRFSNDFVFDQEMAISGISFGLPIGEVPIPTRYHEKQSSIKFLKGSKFIIDGFLTIAALYLHKAGVIYDPRFATSGERKKKHPILYSFLVVILSLLPFLNNYKADLLTIVSVVLASLALFVVIRYQTIKKISILSFLLVMAIMLTNGFIKYRDKDVFLRDRLDLHQMAEKDSYMRIGAIGQLYGRKIGYWYFTQAKFVQDRTLKKVGYPIDIAKYISSNPDTIYPYFLLPFVVIGTILIISQQLAVFFLFLIPVFIFSFIVVPQNTVIPYFVFISVATVVGVKKIRDLIEKFRWIK